MTDLDIQELANLTAGDSDVDNFERLFTKLKEMKGNWEMKKTKQHATKQNQRKVFLIFFGIYILFSVVVWWWSICTGAHIIGDDLVLSDFQPADKASSMPHEQRKVHAEKVTFTNVYNMQRQGLSHF